MVWGQAISAAVGIGVGAMQDSAHEEAMERQHKADKAAWEYQNAENMRAYKWDKKNTKITKKNTFQDIKFNDRQRKQSWKFEMEMRAFDHYNQMRAYNMSEEMYGLQKDFNNIAANIAVQSEVNWLDERVTEAAFQHEGMVLDMYNTQQQSAFLSADNLLGLRTAQGQAALQNRDIALKLQQTMGDAALERMGINLQLSAQLDDAKFARQGNRLELERAETDTLRSREQVELQRVTNEGAALVTQSGRGAAKAVQSVIAQAGMQHSLLNKSLSTADKSAKLAHQRINTQQVNSQKQAIFQGKLVDKKVQDAIQTSEQQKMEVAFGLGIAKSKFDITKSKIDHDLSFAGKQFDLGQRSLNASLQSAAKSFQASIKKINADKFGADINAYGNRMLPPMLAPAAPKPEKLPRPEFLMPLLPTETPKPIKGASSNNTAQAVLKGIGGIAAAGIGNMAGGGSFWG